MINQRLRLQRLLQKPLLSLWLQEMTEILVMKLMPARVVPMPLPQLMTVQHQQPGSVTKLKSPAVLPMNRPNSHPHGCAEPSFRQTLNPTLVIARYA